MKYENNCALDSVKINEIINKGVRIDRDLATGIIHEMSDEDFYKMFTVITEENAFGRDITKITVKLNIQ